MNREFFVDGRTYVYEDDGTYRVEDDGSRTRIANFAMAIENDGWLAEKSDIGIQLAIDGDERTLYANYTPESFVKDSAFPEFPWLRDEWGLDLQLYCSPEEFRHVVQTEYRRRMDDEGDR